jgi:hypothetical protein
MMQSRNGLRIAFVAIVAGVAACGGSTTNSTGGGSLLPTAGSSGSLAPRASVPAPSADVAIAWTSPSWEATVATETLTVAARVGTAQPPAKITFWASSGEQRATVCSASKADRDGLWSCKADLRKSGMRPGPLALGFNVTDRNGIVDKDPAGVVKVTWTVAPGAPTGVRYKKIPGQADYAVKLSWDPASVAGAEAVEIYGLMNCLAPPKSTDKPCIVKGTSLKTAKLVRFASLAPAQGSTTWTESPDDISLALGIHAKDGAYYALLVVAVNEYGKSRFIIARSAASCYDCVIY